LYTLPRAYRESPEWRSLHLVRVLKRFVVVFVHVVPVDFLFFQKEDAAPPPECVRKRIGVDLADVVIVVAIVCTVVLREEKLIERGRTRETLDGEVGS